MLNRIHHVAFIVRDLDKTIAAYERLLGMPVSERTPAPGRGGEIALFKLENVNLEFASPTDPDGFLQQLLDKRGEGFFHLGFGVDDLDEALVEMQQKGIAMAGDTMTVFKDWRITYIDAAETAGIYAHLINNDAQ